MKQIILCPAKVGGSAVVLDHDRKLIISRDGGLFLCFDCGVCRIIGLKDNFVVFVTCVIWSRVFYIGMHYKKCLV